MSCVYPLDCWRSAKRSESGKQPITFKIQDANTDQKLQVPCGKCIGCQKTKSQVWSVRLYHESLQHERNCFVTLTYNEPCPKTINKRDLQLFFKRLRHVHRLRYFACGEYGTRTRRPHYHAIIFGEDFRDESYAINNVLYSQPALANTWGLGLVSVGDASIESMAYTAGYCTKKMTDPDTFNMMSNRPGIGHTWLDKYRDDIVRTEQVVINGRNMPIPKKYLEWYSEEFETLRLSRANFYRNLTPDQVIRARAEKRAMECNYKALEQNKRQIL
ncbi:MAG: replication initiator protein [Microvirus sp.]|nr:MAG: replication initiator protein [Microvirus sp.]